MGEAEVAEFVVRNFDDDQQSCRTSIPGVFAPSIAYIDCTIPWHHPPPPPPTPFSQAITGASRSVALRLLDATKGDLEEAIERFYSDTTAPGPSNVAAAAPAAPTAATRKSSKSGGGSGRKITSLGDLNRDEEDSEDDDHNDYYVGGEKSGQIVKGAPKHDDSDPIGGIFEGARAAGAQEGRASDLDPHGGGGDAGDGFKAFRGRGRTLAGGPASDDDGHHQEEGDGEGEGEEEEDTHKEKVITIAFYANNIFTVNDGEPRRVDDPANAAFVGAIARGVCPPELDPGDPNIRLAVNLVRKAEEYTPPEQPRYVAFAGSGHKLSSGGGGDGGGGAGSTPPPPPPSTSTSMVPWEGADPSKPKTSIQIRLADGSRQVAEFNVDHTVGDIRRFIRAARPDMTTAYTLATAFPPSQLQDDTVTIQSAGLCNAVVIQKM